MVSTYPKEQSDIFILLHILSFTGNLILYWTPDTLNILPRFSLKEQRTGTSKNEYPIPWMGI
jgi:hypothetical protein